MDNFNSQQLFRPPRMALFFTFLTSSIEIWGANIFNLYCKGAKYAFLV